jgi:hypothetical protein
MSDNLLRLHDVLAAVRTARKVLLDSIHLIRPKSAIEIRGDFQILHMSLTVVGGSRHQKLTR